MSIGGEKGDVAIFEDPWYLNLIENIQESIQYKFRDHVKVGMVQQQVLSLYRLFNRK